MEEVATLGNEEVFAPGEEATEATKQRRRWTDTTISWTM